MAGLGRERGLQGGGNAGGDALGIELGAAVGPFQHKGRRGHARLFAEGRQAGEARVCAQRLQPRLAILGHWEDFFGNDPRQPQGLRLQDIRGMVAATRANLPADGQLKLPVPFAQIPLPPLQP